MFKNHFSFHRLPFSTTPDVSGYFPAESIETARRTVLHVLEHGTGIPLIFGESGMGKSLLLRVLEKFFENDFHVVYMANQRLRTPKSLYQHLLFSLHQSYCGMDENELRLLFLDHLFQRETYGMILLVDEAQSLGRSTLEELRVLLHYNHRDNPESLRLVLAGDHRFEERLTHPHLNAFQQQVVARCYLEKFRREETDKEVVWQLKQAGCQTPDLLFPAESRKTVHNLTEGLPRVVHQLCQQTLALAAERNLTRVNETVVQTAWDILQQLPGGKNNIPTAGSPNDNQGTLIIEFGTLDDDEPVATPCDTSESRVVHHPGVKPFEESLLPETPLPKIAEEPETETEFAQTFSFPLPKFDPPDWGGMLSDKVVPDTKQPEVHRRESCQKLLDELSVMEQLLTEEISVINKMKKIESDCLSRRVRRVSPTEILASFPEMPKHK